MDFESYRGDERCDHGRRVGAEKVKACPNRAQYVYRDDEGEFRLCTGHYRNFVIYLRFGPPGEVSRDDFG